MTQARENSAVTSCLRNPQWAPRSINPVQNCISFKETMLFTPAQFVLTYSRSLVQKSCKSDPNHVAVDVGLGKLNFSTLCQQNDSAFVILGNSINASTEHYEEPSRHASCHGHSFAKCCAYSVRRWIGDDIFLAHWTPQIGSSCIVDLCTASSFVVHCHSFHPSTSIVYLSIRKFPLRSRCTIEVWQRSMENPDQERK